MTPGECDMRKGGSGLITWSYLRTHESEERPSLGEHVAEARSCSALD
jgi:hypothetical protein